jgi:futalosine hydrolase
MKESSDVDLLVVAAFSPELAGLEELLGGGLAADVLGRKLAAAPVGIGLVAAASGASAAIARERPAALVLIGTCGAYPGSGLTIGDAVVARAAKLLEPAVVEGRAAFPGLMSAPVAADVAMAAALSAGGAPLVDVGTTLAVTTDDPLALLLSRHAAVEHLEAFAVATACAARSVPFGVVLGVANIVGARGREQWRANHDAAGRVAASCVVQAVRSARLLGGAV